MSELHGPTTFAEKLSNDSFLTLWQNYCDQKELIEELEADRARLEWMARCRAGFYFNLFEGTFAVCYRDTYRARDRASADFKDWRDAIDEAMRNE